RRKKVHRDAGDQVEIVLVSSSRSSSLKSWSEAITKSASPNLLSCKVCGIGTATHFILAALAAIIPVTESSKQMHCKGLTFNIPAQFRYTSGWGFPYIKDSADA